MCCSVLCIYYSVCYDELYKYMIIFVNTYVYFSNLSILIKK